MLARAFLMYHIASIRVYCNSDFCQYTFKRYLLSCFRVDSIVFEFCIIFLHATKTQAVRAEHAIIRIMSVGRFGIRIDDPYMHILKCH